MAAARTYPCMRSIFRSKRLAVVVAASLLLGIAVWRSGSHAAKLPDDPLQLQILAGPGRQDAALARLRELADADSALAQRALGEVLLARNNAPGEAIARLRAAARAGDSDAAFVLGKTLLGGVPGIAAAPSTAVAWLRASAESGHPGAAFHLGIACRNGYGTPTDAAEAARWFARAAAQGVPAAQFMLANAYREGAGVPRDEAKARQLYEEAAEQDHPEAIQTLAMAYRNGELGLAPDEQQARHYLLETAHALKHPALRP